MSLYIMVISLSYQPSYLINKYEYILIIIYKLQSLGLKQTMFTEMKTRKGWQDLITPRREKKAGCGFQDQLIGYNFLRNIWGTYFFDRQEISSEDKIDHINKIVGMMKAQIKLMISHQSNLIQKQIGPQDQDQGSKQNYNFLLIEHQKMKQELQRSRMREEELYTNILKRQQEIVKLKQLNSEQGLQLFQLKQDKNKCEQQIIQLSNKFYQLQRGYFSNASVQLSQLDNTLDQFSAISIDRELSRQKPKFSLFTKRENVNFGFDNTFNDEVHSEQQDNDDHKEVLCQLNLNLPRNKNSLKHSLHFHDKGKINTHVNFIEEMKRMKIKTERIVQIENDRISQRDNRKKTFTANANTFNADLKQKENDCRRFRRIRC